MDVRKTKLQDWFNPFKWYSFAFGFIFKFLVPEYFLEQYFCRRYTPECSPCVKAGECVHCGCDTIAKMRVPHEKCSGGWWGPIMKKEDWDVYKNKYKVKINISYGN